LIEENFEAKSNPRTHNSSWLEGRCSDVVPKVVDKSKLLSPRTVSTTTTAATTTTTATPVPFFIFNRYRLKKQMKINPWDGERTYSLNYRGRTIKFGLDTQNKYAKSF